jgi:hypothetical protein
MYASIRKYRTSDAAELGRRAQGFVPIVRELPGFSGWYLMDGGDGTLVTITLAEDAAAVEQSVQKAADWVGENAADLVEGSPAVTNGKVLTQG